MTGTRKLAKSVGIVALLVDAIEQTSQFSRSQLQLQLQRRNTTSEWLTERIRERWSDNQSAEFNTFESRSIETIRSASVQLWLIEKRFFSVNVDLTADVARCAMIDRMSICSSFLIRMVEWEIRPSDWGQCFVLNDLGDFPHEVAHRSLLLFVRSTQLQQTIINQRVDRQTSVTELRYYHH